MEVLSSANSQSYVFPFNNWIDDKNGLDHIVYRDGVQVRGDGGSGRGLDHIVYRDGVQVEEGARQGRADRGPDHFSALRPRLHYPPE